MGHARPQGAPQAIDLACCAFNTSRQLHLHPPELLAQEGLVRGHQDIQEAHMRQRVLRAARQARDNTIPFFNCSMMS